MLLAHALPSICVPVASVPPAVVKPGLRVLVWQLGSVMYVNWPWLKSTPAVLANQHQCT